MAVKYKTFGQRFCTHCGQTKMYYFIDHINGGIPAGVCTTCDNIDYCDNETVEDVKKRFGEALKPADVEYVYG